MQRTINKEIRHYQEDVFMGLSLRQLLCSAAAVGSAAGGYVLLGPVLGQDAAGWVGILMGAPFAAAGFFRQGGLTLEQWLREVLRTAVVCRGPRLWRAENRYAATRTRRKEGRHEAP